MSVPVAAVDRTQSIPSVGIVGGGLAGLSAACALADAGYKVTLFERRAFLGGRASSYEHPGTGEVVDNCQHVLLGCCTNLLDLYHRLGVEDKVRWYKRITFIEPGGRSSFIEASSLPAPFHSAISFLQYKLLSLRDKLGIARALIALLAGVPEDSSEDFLSWLRRKGQTQAAIDRFWAPVLISSLNEDLDKIFGEVCRDGVPRCLPEIRRGGKDGSADGSALRTLRRGRGVHSRTRRRGSAAQRGRCCFVWRQ